MIIRNRIKYTQKQLTVQSEASAADRSAATTTGRLVRNPDKQAVKVSLDKDAKCRFIVVAIRAIMFAAAATIWGCLSVDIT